MHESVVHQSALECTESECIGMHESAVHQSAGECSADKSGKDVGPVKEISVPSTRSACQQAASYLDFAVQVSITGLGSQLSASTLGIPGCLC